MKQRDHFLKSLSDLVSRNSGAPGRFQRLFSKAALSASLLCVGGMSGDALAAADPTPGNLFSYTGAASATTNSTNSTAQYARFTAMETTTASSLSINLNTVAAGTHTITVGLQADDGTGRPGGVYLASGSLNATTGWNTVNFADYTLQAGTVYHVVVRATAGTVNWRLLNGASSTILPFGYYDGSLARGLITGSTPDTPVTSSTVVFQVGTSGTFQHGVAYTASAWTNVAIGTGWAVPAQRFIFSAQETGSFLDTVSLRLNIGATLPANDLRVVLLDDANAVMGSTWILASEFAAGVADYTAIFDDAIGLTDGVAYRLAIYSEGSASNSVRWGYVATDNAAYTGGTYQGNDAYIFTYTNNNFLGTGTPNLLGDYIFSYTTTAIPEPGMTALFLLGSGGILFAARRRKSFSTDL